MFSCTEFFFLSAILLVKKLNRLSVSLAQEFQAPCLEPDISAPSTRQLDADSIMENCRVLMVDQETRTLDHLENCLKDFGVHDIRSCFDAEEAMHLVGYQSPDIILIDAVGGIDLLRSMRPVASLQTVGVIITSEELDPADKLAALQLGASAFLPRPIDPLELSLSIRNILAAKAYHEHLSTESNRLEHEVRQRIVELESARNDAEQARQRALECLARAAEFRDDDTSQHVQRVGKYAAAIAKRFDLDPYHIELLEQSAQLHDVGKIGISDTILLKPGKLTDDEFEKMRQHCLYGSNIIFPMSDSDWDVLLCEPECALEIICNSTAPVLQLGALIARTHHEKWDGTGYPSGLKGDQIPLVARITAIADVFDALANERPYKKAFPVEKCFQIILEGRGNHFDPAVVDAFFDARIEILAIKENLVDRHN